MFKKGCGLLETPYNFFVDHLAPLCSLLDFPILSSDPRTKLFYHKFYPEIEFRLKRWSIPHLLEHYTHVLYSFVPEPSFKTILALEQQKNPKNPLWSKSIQFIYHFHGCSDKGYQCQWMNPNGHIADVDLLLLYGERMRDILKDKNLLDKPKKTAYTGNYRYLYYQKHQAFFDQKVEEDIFSKFKRDRPILLYAPTWEDLENSCSFFKLPIKVFEALAQEFNILIKLHPNMNLKTKIYDPDRAQKRLATLAKIPHLLALPFYPLIYPILRRISIYMGDFSSVGYDVLAFNKPMFFLNASHRSLSEKSTHLFQCGRAIEPQEFEKIPEILSSSFSQNIQNYLPIQKKTYKYAFGTDLSYEKLKKNLQSLF